MSPDNTPTDGGQPSVASTPVAVTENVTEMLQAVMVRFAQQDEANKATNDRLAALAAILGTLDGEGYETETTWRRLFATKKPNSGVGQPTDGVNTTNADAARTTSGSDTLTNQNIADIQLSLQDVHSRSTMSPRQPRRSNASSPQRS